MVVPDNLDAAATGAWTAHQNELTRPFARLEKGQFSNIRAWRAEVLEATLGKPESLFYSFSGPDVLYATALFPDARNMLFTGLEPVGELPQPASLTPRELVSSLAELRRSLASLLGKSFFVTAQMQAQFHRNRFEGVTPILMLLLARSGYQIEAVSAVSLDPRGELCGGDFGTPGSLPGVSIQYRAADDTAARQLVYLKVDLSNKGLDAHPEYLSYVRQMKPQASYIKSASYLMYGGGFSKIRELILETPALLEDDSGIPFRFFPADQWQASFYGHYSSGASSFPGTTQAKLVAAFASAPQRPLPFWIGYRHGPRDSNLQLYQRRATP